MPVLFASTLFVSALLLFLVQPMVGKMVLPHVGGSSAVWNTCMVFFQALLLLGYSYAHKLTTLKSQRQQVFIHLGVLSTAVMVMMGSLFLTENCTAVPVLKSLAPRGSVLPFFWVILMMMVAIGIPFFAVSTSAPLLQRWFTATGHPSSRDPYFLYAASNAGSLISLLCYPVLVEPNLRLAHQTWLFAGGFVGLVLVTMICGWQSMNPVRPLATNSGGNGNSGTNGSESPAIRRKLRWMFLAFVPSSLMLGITTKMTTDVGSFPLLWIIPLTLYLLTFIIAFSKMPGWVRIVLANLTPVVTLLLVFVETSGVPLNSLGLACLHIANFFLLSWLMHGELAHDRPDPKHLTGYFLWISFGGMLGGLFNSLIAPLIFPQLYEYHLAIVVGCLLLPVVASDIGPADANEAKTKPEPKKADESKPEDNLWITSRILDFAIPLGMLILVGLFEFGKNWTFVQDALKLATRGINGVLSKVGINIVVSADTVVQFSLYAPPCMLCFLCIDRPLRFGLCVLAVLFMSHYREAEREGVLQVRRSFYGILRIDEVIDDHEYPYMPAFPGKTVVQPDGTEKTVMVGTNQTITSLIRSLTHGSTLHGRQYIKDYHLSTLQDDVRALGAFSGWEAITLSCGPWAWDHTKDPLTYYHRTGPVGDLFREAFRRKALPRVGMVGLGTGSAAAYAVGGQQLTFYEIDALVKTIIEAGNDFDTRVIGKMDKSGIEIDPAVRAILRRGGKIDAIFKEIEAGGHTLTPAVRAIITASTQSFTYVTDARKRGADIDIVLGDARLTLDEQSDRKFDLLLIDAFSSDSIPTHLLTVEAVRLYRDRMADNGLLAMHVSNRYLRLEPVVQAIAQELGMVCRLFADENQTMPGKTASSWMVLARNNDELGDAFLAPPPPIGTYLEEGQVAPLTWRPVLPHVQIPAWTDDYMDVLRVTRFAELQAIRRWFGLQLPVKNWEEKTQFLERQYQKPPAKRLYGLNTKTPDLVAVSKELDRVLARKAELKAAELKLPQGDRRFGLNAANPDTPVVSELLNEEIDRLEALDAERKKSP